MSSNTETSSLPVIDYSLKDREAQAKRVVDIMSSLGFLFLENVPGYSEDDLRWCVDFFFKEMPAEKKMQVARIKYNPQNTRAGMTLCTYSTPSSSFILLSRLNSSTVKPLLSGLLLSRHLPQLGS